VCICLINGDCLEEWVLSEFDSDMASMYVINMFDSLIEAGWKSLELSVYVCCYDEFEFGRRHNHLYIPTLPYSPLLV